MRYFSYPKNYTAENPQDSSVLFVLYYQPSPLKITIQLSQNSIQPAASPIDTSLPALTSHLLLFLSSTEINTIPIAKRLSTTNCIRNL